MAEKNSFVLYSSYFPCFQSLSLEDRGRLITAIFEYGMNSKRNSEEVQINQMDFSVDLSDPCKMALLFIAEQMKRDAEKYERICEKRREAAKKAAEKRAERGNEKKPANGTICKQMVPNGSYNDDVDDDVDDNDNDNDNETPPISPSFAKGGKCSPSARTSASDARFDRFWNVYPRKEGKKKAREVFLKLKPDDALTEKMITAVEAWRRSEAWKREGGRYIPLATTWINQGRWEDELPGAPNAPKSEADDYSFIFDNVPTY